MRYCTVIHPGTFSEYLLIHWPLSRFQECTFKDPVLFTYLLWPHFLCLFATEQHILFLQSFEPHCVSVLMGSAPCNRRSWAGFKALKTSGGARPKQLSGMPEGSGPFLLSASLSLASRPPSSCASPNGYKTAALSPGLTSALWTEGR